VNVFQIENKLLDNSDNTVGEDVWDVASIAWPSGDITRIDRMLDIDLL